MSNFNKMPENKIKTIPSGCSGTNVYRVVISIEMKVNAAEKIKHRTQQFINEVKQ